MLRDFRTVAVGIWVVVVQFHIGGEKWVQFQIYYGQEGIYSQEVGGIRWVENY